MPAAAAIPATAPPPRIINGNTLVPLSVILTILLGLGMAFRGYVWLDERLDAIEQQIAKAGGDRWTGSNMTAWSYELAEKNRDLNVPIPATSTVN